MALRKRARGRHRLRRRKARTLRPRDAATLIIVDQSSGEPRVLLGRRRIDMAFMPGRYVFPGGRVDPADRHVAVEQDLEPGDLKKLLVAMKGTASEARARALALAAVRETFEEAGLLIGAPLRASGRAQGRGVAGRSSPRLPAGAGAPDVLRPRHHAARPSAPVRLALLLRAGGGHRPQGADRRRRAVRPRVAFHRPGPLAGVAQHHARRAGGPGRAHRRRRVAHERHARAVLSSPQRQPSAAT